MSTSTTTRNLLTALIISASALSALSASSAADPLENPAAIEIRAADQPVAPGSTARVTLRIVPSPGIKINRYPKIKVTVPAVEGVVEAAEATLGNPKPPPPDDLESNYFKEPEPFEIDLHLSGDAPSGKREIEGSIKYFYCVAASGYCAPARADLKIPVHVR